MVLRRRILIALMGALMAVTMVLGSAGAGFAADEGEEAAKEEEKAADEAAKEAEEALKAEEEAAKEAEEDDDITIPPEVVVE